MALPADARLGQIRLEPAPGAGILGLVLVFLLAAALIYQSNAAWLLLWLSATAVTLSVVAAVRSVRRVVVVGLVVEPVAAGTPGRLQLILAAPRRAWAVQVIVPGSVRSVSPPVHPLDPVAAAITLPALPRGIHRGDTIELASTFPLGLITALRRVAIDWELVVHPAPASDAPAPPGSGSGEAADDFLGHVRAGPGESPRRIDWRAHARGRPLLAKRFAGTGIEVSGELHWDDVADADPERRLSVLTRWFLDAVAGTEAVGLSLPASRLAPGRGQAHRLAGLRLLAGCSP